MRLMAFRKQTTFHCIPLCASAVKPLLTTFTLMISLRADYILISHFLLNLQDLVVRPTDDSDPHSSSSHTYLTTVRFNKVLGNIGAQLRDKKSDDLEDSVDDSMMELSELQSTEEIHHEDVDGPSTLTLHVPQDVGETSIAGSSRHQDMYV